MNKKITSSALAALMIAGSTSFSAFAAMSNGTVVIGDKAFDLAYANDPANAEEITNAIVGMGAEGAVYVKDFDGNWIENATGEKVEASVIPAVTYKDAEGKESKIAKGDEGTVVADGSLKLKSVKAISNTKVEVKLEEAVTGVEAANFAMVKKGTTTALETKSATLSEDGKVVVIETAAMVGGDSYTLTVNEVSKNFTAVKAIKEQVTVKKVESTDDNLVTVTFDKIVDQVSAENIENYKLNNSAVVTGAKLSADRLSVDLTTTGVVAKSKYRVETTNVLSADGTAMKTKQVKDFVAKSFVGAPKVKAVTNLNHYNNEQLTVEFTTTGTELDKESAENVANYTIAGLEVLSAKLQDDDDNNSATSKVILVTSTQTQGKSYTLKVNNIADTSVLKNTMTKEVSKDFKGGYLDKIAPKVTSNEAVSNTQVIVYFDDANKLDATTALDASNYVFDKDAITVESVEFLDAEVPYEKDGRAVILTTSAQEAKSYKLTVKNVQDEYGNTLTKADMRVTGKAVDDIPPYVTGIKAIKQNKIEITFNEVVDKKTAVDPTNYVIYDGADKVSAALSAKFKTDSKNKIVEITVPELDKNKTYSVKLDGVKDMTGNALAKVTVKVVTPGAENDTTAPTIRDVNVIANNEIVVEFDETVKATSTKTVEDIILKSKDGNEFTGRKLYDNGTKLIMVAKNKLQDNVEYEINAGSNIVDMNRNLFANTTDGYKFTGFNGDNAAPEANWEQVNVKTIRFTFDQPVAVPSASAVIGSGWTVGYADVEADDVDASYDDLCVLEFQKTSGVIKTGASNALQFDLTKVQDFAGTYAKNIDDKSKTEVEAFLEDSVAPVINAVEAINNKQINVTFDEELDANIGGSYIISYDDTKGIEHKFTVSGKPKSTDKSIVEIKLSDSQKLNADTTYTLKISNSARDIAGNPVDKTGIEEQFVGSNVIASGGIVSGIVVNEPNVVTISGATKVEDTDVTFDKVTAGIHLDTTDADVKNKVISDIPFLIDVTYEIDGYTFNGSVENDKNLLVSENDGLAYVTFEGMNDDVDGKKAGDNYELLLYTVGADEKVTASKVTISDKLDKDGKKIGVLGYALSNTTKNGDVVYAYLYNKVDAPDADKDILQTYLTRNVMSGAKITVGDLTSVASLKSAVENAKANKDTAVESTDGKDVAKTNKWVTPEVKTAYVDAIVEAQKVVDNKDAKQEDVDNAITTLATATTAFNDAKKDGTKVEVVFAVDTDNSIAADNATLGLVGATVASSDEAVATAAITDGKVVITSAKAGTATMTVKDATLPTAKEATIVVTVAADGTITIGTVTKYEVPFVVDTDNSIAADDATLGLVGATVASSDEAVATAAITGGKVVITSAKAGTATMTVKDATLPTAKEATIVVTVAADGTITIGTVTKYEVPFVVDTDNSIAADDTTLGLVGATVASSDEAVATAAITDGKVVITSAKAGTATMTVKDATLPTAKEATIVVTVAADGTITIGTVTKAA